MSQPQWGQQQPAQPKKSHKVRNALLGVVGGFVVLTAIGSALGGGDDVAVKDGGDAGAVSEETTPAATSPGPSEAAVKPKPAPKPRKATSPAVGDRVRDGKFEFRVTGVLTARKVGSAYLSKTAQGRFYRVNVTVRNVGDEPQTLDSSSQKLYDAAGREYAADGEAGMYIDSKAFLEDINPGNSVKAALVYDLPKNVKPAVIELHDSPFSGGVKVRLVRR